MRKHYLIIFSCKYKNINMRVYQINRFTKVQKTSKFVPSILKGTCIYFKGVQKYINILIV